MYVTSYSPTRLRNIRKRAQLTQEQVEEYTGVTAMTIYNWERLDGKGRRPQSANLDKVLNLYAIRIKRLEGYDQIWGDDGLKNRPPSPAGVAKGVRVDASGDRGQSVADPARRGIQSHAGNGAEKPWDRRTA